MFVVCLFFQLIEKEINPFVDQWEEEKLFPAHKVMKLLGDAGFLGVTKPTGKFCVQTPPPQKKKKGYMYIVT